MKKLGWTIKKEKEYITVDRKTKETEIFCSLRKQDKKMNLFISGLGDLDHHLIEDAMLVLNKLAEIKGVNHKLT